MNINRSTLIAVLNEMPRNELAASARYVGVKVGKSKANTVNNIADAMLSDAPVVRCTVQLTLRKGATSADGSAFLTRKFRSARAGDLVQNSLPTTAE